MPKTIYVYENWSDETPMKLGRLYVDQARGSEQYAFEYDETWLTTSRFAYVLDPDLSLYKGRQYPIDKNTFGIFADSAPDRWGRLLMQRREKFIADKEGRKPKKLLDSDYLLGVYDETRMGAIRFCTEDGGPFLSADRAMAAPPWARLRNLEEASRQFEKDESSVDDKWLRQLIGPGSSLGGARPKATVQAVDGSLWIAKFPSKHDDNNTGAWEKVVHDLARMCGLNVPESRLETFSKLGSTFLVKRFDRDGDRRIHFASAMTMLGKTDGASSSDGTSYLELVSFLRANGASPKTDLVEMFRRVVFNMAVSNTDDHLRNHGFILTRTGWRLSPLFDVNPFPYGEYLALNVSEEDNTIDFDLAVDTAEYYGISNNEAKKIAEEISIVIRNNWERLAVSYKLSRGSIERMRPAFSACEM